LEVVRFCEKEGNEKDGGKRKNSRFGTIVERREFFLGGRGGWTGRLALNISFEEYLKILERV
jgi:hypothetical protein